MTEVYVLQHSRQDEDGIDHEILVGIYSTREKAEAAFADVIKREGFRDFPEALQILDILLDETLWSEGFITVVPGTGEIISPRR